MDFDAAIEDINTIQTLDEQITYVKITTHNDYFLGSITEEEYQLYNTTNTSNCTAVDVKSTIGYVVFVENNIITKIYDNTNNMKMTEIYENMNSQISTYQTNQSKTNENLLNNAAKDIDTSLLEIVDQKIEKFYDENSDRVYYNVSTTVKTPTGETSVFVYQEYIN